MVRLLISTLLAVLLLGSSALAREPRSRQEIDYLAVSADVLVVRPLFLAGTAVGSAIYLVALPFTLTSRDPLPFQVLVAEPAAGAFLRCFGCPIGQRTPAR